MELLVENFFCRRLRRLVVGCGRSLDVFFVEFGGLAVCVREREEQGEVVC